MGHAAHARRPSPVVSATLPRNVVSSCAASAGVHAGLVPSHLVENLWLGIAFAASVGLLLAVIVSLWRAGDPRRPAAPAAAALAAPVAYPLSRTVGLGPLEEELERVDAIGLLTQGVQVAGLIAALHLCHPIGSLSARAARRERS